MYNFYNSWVRDLLSFIFLLRYYTKKNLTGVILNPLLLREFWYDVLTYTLKKSIFSCYEEEINLQRQRPFPYHLSYKLYYCKLYNVQKILDCIDSFALSQLRRRYWFRFFRRKKFQKMLDRWRELIFFMRDRHWREIVQPAFTYMYEADLEKLYTLLADREYLEFDNYCDTINHMGGWRVKHLNSYLTHYLFKEIVEKDHLKKVKIFDTFEKKYIAAFDVEYYTRGVSSTYRIGDSLHEKTRQPLIHYYRIEKGLDRAFWEHYHLNKFVTFNNIEQKKLFLERPKNYPVFFPIQRHYTYWKILWSSWYNTIFHQIYFLQLQDSKFIFSDTQINKQLEQKNYFKKFIVVNMEHFTNFIDFATKLVENKNRYITSEDRFKILKEGSQKDLLTMSERFAESALHKEIRYNLPSHWDQLKQWSPFGSHFISPFRWKAMRKFSAKKRNKQRAGSPSNPVVLRWSRRQRRFRSISFLRK